MNISILDDIKFHSYNFGHKVKLAFPAVLLHLDSRSL